jgi:hypothetical protein
MELNGILESALNGAKPKHPREPEMVSPKTLSEIWDVELETIRGWIKLARTKPQLDPFPFKKFPGSTLVRIPLKEAREWRDRANF